MKAQQYSVCFLSLGGRTPTEEEKQVLDSLDVIYVGIDPLQWMAQFPSGSVFEIVKK